MKENKLEWIDSPHKKLIFAHSNKAENAAFRIFYDDVMYWDNFSDLDPTQDLEILKKIAQDIHGS